MDLTNLENARSSEIQKLKDEGNALKTNLINELTEAKNNLAHAKATNTRRNEVFRNLCLW